MDVIIAVCIINGISLEDLNMILLEIFSALKLDDSSKRCEILDRFSKQKKIFESVTRSEYIDNVIIALDKKRLDFRLRKYGKNLSELEATSIKKLVKIKNGGINNE